MKIAIRIVSGETGKTKLFAITSDGPAATRHYNLAKQSIPTGSSDWVHAGFWTQHGEFRDQNEYFDYPAGNLF